MRRSDGWRGSNGSRGGPGGSILAGLVALGLCAFALPVSAQSERAVDLQVLVCHASDSAGAIDPSCRRMHEQIHRNYRYESLRELASRRMRLAPGQGGSLKLPDGGAFRVRLNDVDERGALLAVDLEGVQTDLRVRSGHLVVIGGDRYQDGKLVVGLEPKY